MKKATLLTVFLVAFPVLASSQGLTVVDECEEEYNKILGLERILSIEEIDNLTIK